MFRICSFFSIYFRKIIICHLHNFIFKDVHNFLYFIVRFLIKNDSVYKFISVIAKNNVVVQILKTTKICRIKDIFVIKS